jgi:hypothetical protein
MSLFLVLVHAGARASKLSMAIRTSEASDPCPHSRRDYSTIDRSIDKADDPACRTLIGLMTGTGAPRRRGVLLEPALGLVPPALRRRSAPPASSASSPPTPPLPSTAPPIHPLAISRPRSRGPRTMPALHPVPRSISRSPCLPPQLSRAPQPHTCTRHARPGTPSPRSPEPAREADRCGAPYVRREGKRKSVRQSRRQRPSSLVIRSFGMKRACACACARSGEPCRQRGGYKFLGRDLCAIFFLGIAIAARLNRPTSYMCDDELRPKIVGLRDGIELSAQKTMFMTLHRIDDGQPGLFP